VRSLGGQFLGGPHVDREDLGGLRLLEDRCLTFSRDDFTLDDLENPHPAGDVVGHRAFVNARAHTGGRQRGFQEFTVRTLPVQPGDTFVVFTDGMTEVRDAAGREFGEDRFLDLVRRSGPLPLAQLERTLFEAVRAFGQQDDDQTLLTVRVLAPDQSNSPVNAS